MTAAIAELLASSGEKHEDPNKQIELFKKVEIKFNQLLEWRISVKNSTAVVAKEGAKKKERRLKY